MAAIYSCDRIVTAMYRGFARVRDFKHGRHLGALRHVNKVVAEIAALVEEMYIYSNGKGLLRVILLFKLKKG